MLVWEQHSTHDNFRFSTGMHIHRTSAYEPTKNPPINVAPFNDNSSRAHKREKSKETEILPVQY